MGPFSGFQPIWLMWSARPPVGPRGSRLDAAGRIGQHHGADSQRAQHAHGKRDLERRVALVVVHAPLHDDNRRSAEQPRHDAPRVAFDGGLRKMRNLAVGHDGRIGDRIGHSAQPRAQHDADKRRARAQFGFQKGGSFRDLVVVGHRKEQAVRFGTFYRFENWPVGCAKLASTVLSRGHRSAAACGTFQVCPPTMHRPQAKSGLLSQILSRGLRRGMQRRLRSWPWAIPATISAAPICRWCCPNLFTIWRSTASHRTRRRYGLALSHQSARWLTRWASLSPVPWPIWGPGGVISWAAWRDRSFSPLSLR